MKKVISIILAVILILSVFIACVDPVESNTDKEKSTTNSTTTTEETTINSVSDDKSNVADEESTTKPTEPATTSKTSHTHSYSAATCTKPKTCSCGATEGSAKGHQYSSGKCTVCSATDPSYVAEPMVWITKTGKKYHCISKCGNTKSSTQVTLSAAKNKGLTACEKCY